MQKIGMIYVIFDYERDIVCACENEDQANEVIAQQEEGVLLSALVPLYGPDLPTPAEFVYDEWEFAANERRLEEQ